MRRKRQSGSRRALNTRLIDPPPAHPSAYAPLCSMPNSVVVQLHPMLSLQAQDELESTYDALLASLEAVEVRSAALSKGC